MLLTEAISRRLDPMTVAAKLEVVKSGRPTGVGVWFWQGKNLSTRSPTLLTNKFPEGSKSKLVGASKGGGPLAGFTKLSRRFPFTSQTLRPLLRSAPQRNPWESNFI